MSKRENLIGWSIDAYRYDKRRISEKLDVLYDYIRTQSVAYVGIHGNEIIVRSTVKSRNSIVKKLKLTENYGHFQKEYWPTYSTDRFLEQLIKSMSIMKGEKE